MYITKNVFICRWSTKQQKINIQPAKTATLTISHIPVNSCEVRLFWITGNPKSLGGSTRSHLPVISVVFRFCGISRIYLMFSISGNP